MTFRAKAGWGKTVAFCFFLLAFHAGAQGVDWKTNYFVVTGTNRHEIRESIAKNRPFKEPFDAFTVWSVRWNFAVRPSPEGCRCTSATTVTTVTMHMPWWKIPTNAPAETKEWWRNYYTRLLDHEVGHARIGLTAAAHLRQHLIAQPPSSGCDTMKQQLDNAANALMADYRRQDKEYDVRTGHGSRGNQ